MALAGLMTEEHKKLFQKHWQVLVDNMTDEILNPLFTNEVITRKQYEKIKQIGNETTRNEELLLVMLRKPDSAFYKFLDCLEETEQGHIAKAIKAHAGITGKSTSGGTVCSPSGDHGQQPVAAAAAAAKMPEPVLEVGQEKPAKSAPVERAPIQVTEDPVVPVTPEPAMQESSAAQAAPTGLFQPDHQSVPYGSNADREKKAGMPMALKGKEIDYRMNIDDIIAISRNYKTAEMKPPVIAVVDTGIHFNEDFPVIHRLDKDKNITNEHGTYVAQIIKRHCPLAEIVDVQISRNKDGSFEEADMAKGLKKLQEWEKKKKKHADIINISMGLDRMTGDDVQDVIHDLCKKHIIICAASNEGRLSCDSILVPARMEGTIAVGSHDELGNRCEFSPEGEQLDFLCPGEFCLPVPGKKELASKQGTSFSAPVASAIAAHILIATRHFYAKTQQTARDDVMKVVGRTSGMKNILRRMCTHPDSRKRIEGWGLLRPYKLYERPDLQLKDAIMAVHAERC